jgi:transposase
MTRRGTAYPDEFRSKLLDLYDSGRSIASLARDFEPCEATIRNWVKQRQLDDGEREDGLTSDEQEELRELRAENRKLKEERDILKKAAAWFAQETDPTTNSGSSNS